MVRVVGYKAVSDVMKANNGYQFEPGRLHRVHSDPYMCKRGFHFCERLEDVFRFWEVFSKDNGLARIFRSETTARSTVIEQESTGKLVSNSIRLTYEMTIEEILEQLEREQKERNEQGKKNGLPRKSPVKVIREAGTRFFAPANIKTVLNTANHVDIKGPSLASVATWGRNAAIKMNYGKAYIGGTNSAIELYGGVVYADAPGCAIAFTSGYGYAGGVLGTKITVNKNDYMIDNKTLHAGVLYKINNFDDGFKDIYEKRKIEIPHVWAEFKREIERSAAL